jgi:GNAT superfamily N-acetyltransferase
LDRKAEHTLRFFFEGNGSRLLPAVERIANMCAVEAQKPLGLSEKLGLIGLIGEGIRSGSSKTPVVGDLFSDLWDLVNTTVSGSKISRLKPEDTRNGFQVFEINSATGENLGRLNMLYLKKPIPCYYLVYVEVAGPFRRKGLGSRILEYFRDFLIENSAIGILDNIIPEEDPTYSIYFKLGWEPLEAFIGDGILARDNHFMIYVPPRLRGRPLREPILKIVYHLKRKRAAIDMRDNEVMVQRTIAEFKDLYVALLTYFDTEIAKGKPTPLMRFMFTRFVTKLISFRRRIGTLLGYTGGDSLEQIVLAPKVAAIQMKTYPPSELTSDSPTVMGDIELWNRLPEMLKNNPARTIESLPNYGRPSLASWLKERGMIPSDRLTIGDLMDLGFDPTRLKEITIDNEKFIFERIHARQLTGLAKRQELLRRVKLEMPGIRVWNAELKVNLSLLVISDRGNAYVLRRKVGGIHWEEAVEQLQSAPLLKNMNASMKMDRLLLGTVRKANETIAARLGLKEEVVAEALTFFVPWDFESNRPRLMIDFTNSYLEFLWMV